MPLSTTELQRIWVISYDIADPRRLSRVAKHLEQHAARVQKSVFEARLDTEQRRKLTMHLAGHMNANEDSLLWHPVCRRCQEGMITIGNFDRTLTQTYWIV